jgi:replicative DNA helicase
MKAGMERNIGHEYMVDVEKRMSVMARNTIKTNWSEIDNIMDGGLAAGELGIVTACAGAGKSWVLAKLGAEAMKQGKNVVHITLELNENYVGLRYDSCFTGIDFQNIRNNVDIVRQKIEKVPGKLFIKYFPIKTVSAHHLKMHTERVMMLGTKVDMIIVDYADILRPYQSERNSNSYSEAGGIYEELRSIAGELQIPIWTASQSNRSAMEEDIIQANSIADSYRKIMTADFVMSVSRKVTDKVANTARFHIIKNRFGPDGLTFPSRMNAGCGDIQIFAESSKDGMAIINEMGDSENLVKKALSNKWNAHMSEDEE